MQVNLEETPLKEVQKGLGGTIGSRGDASEALRWLCFHGSDAKGRWALWLESNTLIFDHEHQKTVRNEPFTASNTVYVELRGGGVWAVQVWKATSN